MAARTSSGGLGSASVALPRATLELKDENARLWRSYNLLKDELALLKRRMFVATAGAWTPTSFSSSLPSSSRSSTHWLARWAQRARRPKPRTAVGAAAALRTRTAASRPKPTGRRKLEESGLPEVPIDILDPLFEQLVAEGKRGASASSRASSSRTSGVDFDVS